jgi:hypothetical protein
MIPGRKINEFFIHPIFYTRTFTLEFQWLRRQGVCMFWVSLPLTSSFPPRRCVCQAEFRSRFLWFFCPVVRQNHKVHHPSRGHAEYLYTFYKLLKVVKLRVIVTCNLREINHFCKIYLLYLKVNK